MKVIISSGRPMKLGFTLIELSVVLVIIGILVGGILVAQSMTKTAQLQSFVRQIGQFDAAVANFTTSYRRLPGDNVLFGSAGVIEDGKIMPADGSNNYYNGEITRFWNDLANVGLKNETGAPYVVGSGNVGIGTQIPKSKISTNAGIIAHGDPNSAGNYYTIFQFSGSLQQLGGVVPSDGEAIDIKIDDGNYTRGNVTLGNDIISPWFVCTTTCSPDATCILSYPGGGSGVMVPSTTSEVCSMSIRIGAITGNLQ